MPKEGAQEGGDCSRTRRVENAVPKISCEKITFPVVTFGRTPKISDAAGRLFLNTMVSDLFVTICVIQLKPFSERILILSVYFSRCNGHCKMNEELCVLVGQ
jgi:hypothetical protein